MATFEIFMPALSSTMTEGKIVEWLKQPGDRVERGESVLVVESDKADMDVESFEAGFLGAVLLPAGGTAPVGETIGLVVETEAELAELKANGPAVQPAAQAPAPTPAPAAEAPAAPAPAPVPAAAPRSGARLDRGTSTLPSAGSAVPRASNWRPKREDTKLRSCETVARSKSKERG